MVNGQGFRFLDEGAARNEVQYKFVATSNSTETGHVATVVPRFPDSQDYSGDKRKLQRKVKEHTFYWD